MSFSCEDEEKEEKKKEEKTTNSGWQQVSLILVGSEGTAT